ncbi:hypothetical protein CI610_01975 [invertebrate metagenome]|uniref:Uncharacterized protein n=1 Tax=invertebrate metagenome TaxID=1711999 RepID=A0A2H9T755_9ZZZZ
MNHHSNDGGYHGEGVKAEGWISYKGYGFYFSPDWLGMAEGMTAAYPSDHHEEKNMHHFKQSH